MTTTPVLEAAADEALRDALAGRALVSAERFCASGRTTYACSRPIAAARPTLALGCYPAWPHHAARPAMQAAAEQDTGVRGPAQRRTWMHDLDRRAQALLSELPAPPVIAAWYADDRLRAWAARAGGVVAAIDGRVRAVVEDKARFDALLAAAGVPARLRIPAIRVDGRLPGLAHLQRTVGARRLVIQAGCESGGRGTRFVSTGADLDRAAADLAGPYRVAAFIEGWASNVTVLNVPDGRGGVDVYVDRPSHKAVGVAEAGIGPAKSAGNDWSRPWPGRAATDLIEAAVRIGEWLWRRHRLAGLFGLDALLTPDGQVLLNEINCRKQGTTETSAVNQHLAGLPAFLIAHLTVLLGGQVHWLPGAEAANTATLEAATGSGCRPFYLKLRHRHATPARLRGLSGPGVYQLSAAGLRWLRPGATPADADTDAGEVLLADLPAEHVLLLPGAELGTAEGVTCGPASPFAGPHELSTFGRSLLSTLSAQLSPESTPERVPVTVTNPTTPTSRTTPAQTTATAPGDAYAGLREQLRTLPDEAFTRLQYIAPAVGCFNRCAFCSQSAGRDVWQLTPHGLHGVLTSVAQVAAERGLAVAGARIHRPGVIFPYLDNDIGSYPHLDTYAALARQELGVKLRISTVGYSRHATHLAAMHQRLVAEHADVFDGVRLSITPYTAGYLGTGELSRQEYVQDLAAALATYRPLLERLGHGAATAACELRFAPLVGIHDLLDTHIDGRHVLACGPHLLIARQSGTQPLPETVIDRLDERTQPVYSRPGAPYLHITCHDHEPADLAELVSAALAGTLRRPHQARLVRLHRFSNGDGPYYAADPDFHSDGRFTALHLYPRTDQRKASGYTDATRWYLNTLLAYKNARGLQRRDEFPDATPGDVQAVLDTLLAQADTLSGYDSAAVQHVREQIHPQVAAYAHALELAGLPPAAFFSPRFSIDTGQIVNQGRAQGLFRGLAATNGEPMTPREERGFGYASLSSARGAIWRITPLPLTGTRTLPIAVTGKKNPATTTPSLLVQELDPCHLSPTMRATGCRLRSHTLTLPDGALEHLTLQQGRADYALPGLPSTT